MSEPFSNVTTPNDEFVYSNIRIKWTSNIIRIPMCAHSQVQIYLDIPMVNMWHLNIFRYPFNKLCGIQIYSDICSGPFHQFCSSLDN